MDNLEITLNTKNHAELKKKKHLGYTFQKNGQKLEHIKEVAKKANIESAQVLGIGQRKFTHNYRLRMLLFNKIVRPIVLYGADIWGWREHEKFE